MKINLVLTFAPVSFPEWRTGRSLPCQSVQLADSCDCHDEFPVHPCRPLSRNDWRNQGKPTTQVRNRQQTVWPASMLWFSFKRYWMLRFVLNEQCCAFSWQRLFVSADPSGAECHPVCHWTVAVPHLPPEIHPQGSPLLPWMDLWIPWKNEHVN